MSDKSTDFLNRIQALRTYRSGKRRAPHKPLLLLYAIAKLQYGERKLSFDEVRQALNPLLLAYAPPVKNGRHQPELPYWHLATDGLWVVKGAEHLARQASVDAAPAGLDGRLLMNQSHVSKRSGDRLTGCGLTKFGQSHNVRIPKSQLLANCRQFLPRAPCRMFHETTFIYSSSSIQRCL